MNNLDETFKQQMALADQLNRLYKLHKPVIDSALVADGLVNKSIRDLSQQISASLATIKPPDFSKMVGISFYQTPAFTEHISAISEAMKLSYANEQAITSATEGLRAQFDAINNAGYLSPFPEETGENITDTNLSIDDSDFIGPLTYRDFVDDITLDLQDEYEALEQQPSDSLENENQSTDEFNYPENTKKHSKSSFVALGDYVPQQLRTAYTIWMTVCSIIGAVEVSKEVLTIALPYLLEWLIKILKLIYIQSTLFK